MKYLSILVFLPFCFYAQLNLKGIILDETSGQVIPYANIGIVGKPVGTVSNELGEFSFMVNPTLLSDSIKVSCIGYKVAAYLTSELLKIDQISLKRAVQQLAEVEIVSKKFRHLVLGTKKYSTNNCSGFADISGNWKGSETAVFIKNKKTVYFETFSFYVIQNKYPDSLLFRLMFYERIPGRIKGKINENENWVGPTFLTQAIIFKLAIKQGEFTLPLYSFNIKTSNDFFISLECLMDEMEINKFCYAGSAETGSFFKVKAFSKWHKTHGSGKRQSGGGADFKLAVAY
jgi:hypothetical protein